MPTESHLQMVAVSLPSEVNVIARCQPLTALPVILCAQCLELLRWPSLSVLIKNPTRCVCRPLSSLAMGLRTFRHVSRVLFFLRLRECCPRSRLTLISTGCNVTFAALKLAGQPSATAKNRHQGEMRSTNALSRCAGRCRIRTHSCLMQRYRASLVPHPS